MRISDWSSDVCSSDPIAEPHAVILPDPFGPTPIGNGRIGHLNRGRRFLGPENQLLTRGKPDWRFSRRQISSNSDVDRAFEELDRRSEEHTSELQSLMRISYAVFCLKKKNT